MTITTLTSFRQKIKFYLDAILKNDAPLFISRSKGENFVVISQSTYEGMLETYHLLKSPKNAERLQQSIKQLGNGNAVERNLIEE